MHAPGVSCGETGSPTRHRQTVGVRGMGAEGMSSRAQSAAASQVWSHAPDEGDYPAGALVRRSRSTLPRPTAPSPTLLGTAPQTRHSADTAFGGHGIRRTQHHRAPSKIMTPGATATHHGGAA